MTLVFSRRLERRLRCVVPFCRHTRGQRKGEPAITAETEWICGTHWRQVPRRLKLSMRRARRRDGIIAGDRWRACKRAAIEAAAGIG